MYGSSVFLLVSLTEVTCGPLYPLILKDDEMISCLHDKCKHCTSSP